MLNGVHDTLKHTFAPLVTTAAKDVVAQRRAYLDMPGSKPIETFKALHARAEDDARSAKEWATRRERGTAKR